MQCTVSNLVYHIMNSILHRNKLEMTPLVRFYNTLVTNQSTKIGLAIPFVVLIQIGTFLEAYGECARTLNDVIGLKLKEVHGTVTAGFPVCSTDKVLQQLTAKGFGVLRVLQLEDSQSKNVRLANDSAASKITKRSVLALDTAVFVQEGSLGIIQGDSCLVYFVQENSFIETVGRVLETLMEYRPTEIICSDNRTSQSVRSLFPQCVLRSAFPHGFTPTDTLCTYLRIVSRDQDIQQLHVRDGDNAQRMILDAQTIMNLTLFESQGNGSLFKSLNCCKTKRGAEKLRSILFTPIQSRAVLMARQESLRSLIGNPYLDSMYNQMPALQGSYHTTVFKVMPIVQTPAAISKWIKTINGIIDEVRVWNEWGITAVETLHIPWKTMYNPPLLVIPEFTFDAFALETMRLEQPVPCTFGTGKYMWILETSAEHKTTINNLVGATILTQSKKIIRYDTRDLQVLRLDQNEAEIQYVIKKAHVVESWLAEYRKKTACSQFAQCAHMDALVSTAYFFSSCPEQWCWPIFEGSGASNISLPRHMSNGHSLQPNNINAQQAVLYGHNGSGKSTYMKACGINLLLAHCGLPVFAKSFQTPVRDALFLRFGSNDSLAEGKSSFDVEMEHAHSILTMATERTAVFCDELGCSCDAPSGVKICHWFLNQFKKIGCFLVFATHFDIDASIGLHFKEMDNRFKIKDAGDTRTRNALQLAEKCGMPSSILYFAESILKH
jgi:DNA mismatch repair ATPase MutS